MKSKPCHIFVTALCCLILSASLWAQKQDVETIYVVQPQGINLQHRLEALLLGQYLVQNRLMHEGGMGASLLYHIRQNFALELSGAWLFEQSYNHLINALHEKNYSLSRPDALEYAQMPWYIVADAQWTPIHGKLSFYNWTLGQFGVYFLLGAGAVGVKVNDPSLFGKGEIKEIDHPIQPAGVFGGGASIYFFDALALRLELRDLVSVVSARYKGKPVLYDQDSNENLQHRVFLQAGVGIVF